MPIYVDKSGQLFEADDGQAEALAQQGMQPASDQDIARHNEAIDYEEKSALGKAGELAQTGAEGVGRGLLAPSLAIARAVDPTVDPLEEGWRGYTPEALRRRERNPVSSGIGESLPSAAVGLATGGLGTGLGASAALLGVESALSGLSQEAIDSVVAKRDFAASSALWNGMLDLAFGAVGYGLGRGARAAFGGADEVADIASGAAPRVRRRNWLGEIDKGPVPDDGMPGVGRAARSAGAAGEDFTDDVWDEAIKSIDDAGGGKGLAAEAQFLADPKTAEPLTELASAQVADNLDEALGIVQKDFSELVRVGDVRKAAASWTDDMLDAQDEWVAPNVLAKADEVTNAIREAKKAASVGEGFDVGGFGAKAIRDITAGAARVQKTTGADRFNAIVNLKRGLDGVIRDVTNARSLNQGDAAQFIETLRPFADDLRAGVRREELWGAAAPMQGAVDDSWAAVIEPLQRVEARLTERLGHKWGEVGQAKINRRAKTAAVGQLLRAKASENREFLGDVAAALDGLDDLAAARQAHGLSRLDGVPRLQNALREIRADLNMADVLAVARRKAGEAGEGSFGAKAAEFVAAEGLSMATVGLPGGSLGVKAAKAAWNAIRNSSALPKPGTPLRRVLDARLRAWSRNPDLADAGVSRRLPAWLRGALKGHGGAVAGGAAVVGALGALEGEAEASEYRTPEQEANRRELAQHMAELTPEEQQIQIRTVEGFSRIGAEAERKVAGAVSELFEAALDPDKPVRRSTKTRQLERRANELGVSRGVARFMGRGTDDLFEAFDSRSATIKRVVQDPAALARSMADNLGDLPRLQPEIFAHMVAQTYRAAAYLFERMPGRSGASILNPEGYAPTYDEIEEWAGHWVGALHPLETLDDLAANDLQPEQTDAVKALHREAYAMFQRVALRHIALLSHRGRALPQQAMELIDSALDLNGAGDPLLSWGWADIVKQAEATPAQRTQGPPKASAQQMNFETPEMLRSSSLASLQPL
jgi:hypothetical protein